MTRRVDARAEERGSAESASSAAPKSAAPNSVAPKNAATEHEPIGRVAQVLSSPIFWCLVVASVFLAPFAAAWRRPAPEPPKIVAELPTFDFTDQNDRPFGTSQLTGKVWVANFMFTSCPSVCVGLSERMYELQHRTRNLGDAFHLVSFTVDPDNDTPEKLAAYAKRFRASPRRWTFVTGPLDKLETTIVKGFKLAMGKDEEVPTQLFHSERLVLVDQRGQIRGYYEANDMGIAKLLEDINIVVNHG
jgi:protein SCO1/2